MSILNSVRCLFNQFISPLGFEVVRVNHSTMAHAVRRLPLHGFKVNSVIDIGSAAGTWTALAEQAYPEAKILMVEALAEREEILRARCRRRPHNVFCHIGAVGSQKGSAEFLVNPDFLDGSGMVAGNKVLNAKPRQVPVTPIDDLVKEFQLAPPYCLKFDTHGYEVPILEGATRTLAETTVIIMECYCFRGSEKMLLFWEMCDLLTQHGFRCFDLVDPMLRPKDGMLWQMDLFFARADWSAFQKNQFE